MRTAYQALIMAGVFLSALATLSQAQKKDVDQTQQRPRIYADKNGYFTALPPSSWTQKDFPSETIRSKAEFVDPQKKGISIRVIVAPTEKPSVSLDEFLAEVQNKVTTALTPRFPNIKWAARKEMFRDREAVVLTGSGPGVEQQIVQYIHKGLNYSVALNTNTREDFVRAEPVFQRFLDSFTILEGGKSLSEAERRAAQVSRFKRLAILQEKRGQIADAIHFAKEGLLIEPSDSELKEIVGRLSRKK